MANRRQMIAMGISSCLGWAATSSASEPGQTRKINVTLVDPRTGEPLNETGKVRIRVRDKEISRFKLPGSSFAFYNDVDDPIEVQIESDAGHVLSLQRLAWRKEMNLTVVVWPPGGPETLDRIFDQLQDYERLFFQYGLSSTASDRNEWVSIQQRYAPMLVQMKRPEAVNQALRMNGVARSQEQIDFLNSKLTDVWQMYQIVNGQVIVGKPSGHCDCHRRRCCWCGKPK